MFDTVRLTKEELFWGIIILVWLIFTGSLFYGGNTVDYSITGEYYKARLYNSLEVVYKTEEGCYFAVGDDTCYHPEMDEVEILHKVRLIRSDQ